MVPAFAGLLVVACQASPLSPSPTDPPERVTTTTLVDTVTTIGAAEGSALFRECMSDLGIDIDPIPMDAQGRPRLDLVMGDVEFDDPATVSALDACAGLLLTGALAIDDTPVRGPLLEALARFATCMRDRGVTGFPDPVAGFHGVGFAFPPAEIPYEDPDLMGAIDTCRGRLLAP